MKAAIVVSSISRAGGGVSEAVRLLAGSMHADPDMQVEVATLKDAYFEQDRADWDGVKVSGYRYFGPKNYGFSPGLLLHMLRCDAHIVHVHGLWMFHCLCVLIWSLRTGRPYLVSPHGMLEPWIVKRSARLKRWVTTLYQQRFLRRAAAFHVLTAKETVDVEQAVPDSRTEVVPNFMDIRDRLDQRPPWWQDSFANKTLFLFLGRITEKKGWRELCDAWEMLCSRDAAFCRTSQLVFVGWLDQAAGFEEHVAKLQSSHGNAIYAGSQFGEDKQKTMEAASVFILPSKSEGLPMVVLEAWAAGVPVLMTPACNLPMGFDYGAALEIGATRESIAEGLLRAARWSPAEHQGMAASALALVREQFSRESVLRQMKALYAALVQRSRLQEASHGR